MGMKIIAKDLRSLSLNELEEKYKQVKTALLHTRQRNLSSNCTPLELYNSKRNVACVMTILKEKRLEEIIKECSILKKPLPKELRNKLTKRKRQSLTPLQLSKNKNGRSRFYGKRRLVYGYSE